MPRSTTSRTPLRTPRRPARSRKGLVVGVVVASLLVLVGAVAAALYLLPAWWFSRQVRQAAYARYVNFGQDDRVRGIIDRYHSRILAESCPPRSCSAVTLEVGKYNSQMDATVRRELAKPPDDSPAALAAPPATPTASVATEAEGATPDANPAQVPSAAPNRPSIRSVSAKKAEEGTTETRLGALTVRVDIQVADAPDGALDEGGRQLRMTIRCPGGTATAIEPAVSAEPPQKLGTAKRYFLNAFIPRSTPGSSAGICELAVQLVDADGQESKEAKAFVALE